MKIALIKYLGFFSLLFLISCVQGPMNLSSITLQDFPQISSSSPVGSSISLTNEDAARTFSLTITNNSTEGFHTQWTLNSIVNHAYNDQLNYSFDPKSNAIGVGTHTLIATVYSSDGSKILGSRTWYVTVASAIQVTGRNPSASAVIRMTDAKRIDDGAFGVKVNGTISANAFGVVVNRSLINGESLASVKFFHKDNLSSSCTDESNVACAMTQIGTEQTLVANSYTYLTDFAPSFSIDIAPDDGPSQIHQIIAKVYHKEPAPSVVKTEVGDPIIWSVEVLPLNQRPKIAFSASNTSSSQDITLPQDTVMTYSFVASDLETATANLVATFEFSQDGGTTWSPVDGATFIEGHLTPNCNGAGNNSCAISFPSHSLAVGDPTPLAPKTYYVRVKVTDGGQNSGIPLDSQFLSWKVTTTEKQTLATVNPPTTVAATEGLTATITYTVTDSQYDNYCVQIVRYGDGDIQKITTDVTAGAAVNSTEYCPATALLYPLEAGDTRSLSFFIPYDTVSADGPVAYTLRIREILSIPTATSTTRSTNFTVNVTNDNPAPVLTPGTATPAITGTQFDVVTGAEFEIAPGTFSDPSYIAGATNIENKLYYTWQVALDAADCSAATYNNIAGATNESGTAIELDNVATSYAATKLVWTPPASSAGQAVCFRLCYRDDGETGCAHNQTWTGATVGPLTGLVAARSNVVNHSASITNIVAMSSTTDISVSPAITYSAIAEDASGAYKIALTTHNLHADNSSAVLIAAYTPTLSVEVRDISIARDSVTGNLYVATLVNDGINAAHNLVYVTVHDNTGALIPGSEFQMTNYARAMGQIVFDGANWYLPYIESTNRQLVMTAGTSAAVITETTLSDFGLTNKSIRSIRSSVPTQRMILGLERDDSSLSLYSLSLADTTFTSADITSFKEDIFGTDALKSIRLTTNISDIDADNDIYVMAVNQDNLGKIGVARFDLDGSSEAIMTNINTASPYGAIQNVDQIEITPRSSGDEMIISILNNNNNLYVAKLPIGDASSDAWTLTSDLISYQVNPVGESALTAITTSSILESYELSQKNDGLTYYSADTLFFFYGTGTEVHSALINLDDTNISAISESSNGHHPGFFK